MVLTTWIIINWVTRRRPFDYKFSKQCKRPKSRCFSKRLMFKRILFPLLYGSGRFLAVTRDEYECTSHMLTAINNFCLIKLLNYCLGDLLFSKSKSEKLLHYGDKNSPGLRQHKCRCNEIVRLQERKRFWKKTVSNFGNFMQQSWIM